MNYNCSYLSDLRNLQEQVKKHSATKDCSDFSLFEWIVQVISKILQSFSQSLEQFLFTVCSSRTSMHYVFGVLLQSNKVPIQFSWWATTTLLIFPHLVEDWRFCVKGLVTRTTDAWCLDPKFLHKGQNPHPKPKYLDQ